MKPTENLILANAMKVSLLVIHVCYKELGNNFFYDRKNVNQSKATFNRVNNMNPKYYIPNTNNEVA